MKNFRPTTTKLVNKAASGKIFEAMATTTVKNLTGIHLTPASMLTQKAQTFQSTIRLKSKDKIIDAKSILQVAGMNLRCGDELTILATGSDAQRAVDELVALIDSGFGFKLRS